MWVRFGLFLGLKNPIFQKRIFMPNPLGFIHPPVDPTYVQSMGRFAADLCAQYPENHLVVLVVVLVLVVRCGPEQST